MAESAYMYFDGDIVPNGDANIHVNSPAAKYGIDVFEGIRGYWNDEDKELYVFRLCDHARCLKQSMKILWLDDNFSLETLENAVLDMIRANEFHGKPLTPGVTSDVLESITCESLMQPLDERLSLETEQRNVDRTEIYTADEAFLCVTLAEVTPIISLDGLPIGDGTVGTVTRAIQDHCLNVAQGKNSSHPEWRSPVYGNR